MRRSTPSVFWTVMLFAPTGKRPKWSMIDVECINSWLHEQQIAKWLSSPIFITSPWIHSILFNISSTWYLDQCLCIHVDISVKTWTLYSREYSIVVNSSWGKKTHQRCFLSQFSSQVTHSEVQVLPKCIKESMRNIRELKIQVITLASRSMITYSEDPGKHSASRTRNVRQILISYATSNRKNSHMHLGPT